MLIISILVNTETAAEQAVKATYEMPGHLARRFQQIAVAVFLAEIEGAGYDLTPVQYVALAAVSDNPSNCSSRNAEHRQRALESASAIGVADGYADVLKKRIVDAGCGEQGPKVSAPL